MALLCRLGIHDWFHSPQGVMCVRCGQKDSSQPPTAKSDAWQLGQIVLDEFLVKDKLGEGGMGTVYLMVSKRDHRRFAAKRTHLSSGESRIQFLREMQVWIDLPPHPHVLLLQFFRTLPDGLMIFTEYMAGGSMQDWLGSPKLQNLATILDLAIQYAWGLHALHELGLIHQDVKPGNALIDNSGILKVADFGLTRAQRYSDPTLVVDTGSDTQVTYAGKTPAYCSPEQAQEKRLTKHTDIWSWGLSVLAMFGYAPKKKDSGTAALQILKQLETRWGKIAGVPALPKAVAEILRRCFHEQPQARWSTLLEAAQALVRLYPQLCGQAYSRPTPAFLRAAERRRVEHDRRVGSAQYEDPRPVLEVALRADGRDPSEAEQMLAAQASSRKGQVVGDLILYEAAYQIFDRLVQEGLGNLQPKLAQVLAGLCRYKAFVHQCLDDPSGQMASHEQAIAIYRRLIEQEGHRELEPELAKEQMNLGTAFLKLGQPSHALVHWKTPINTFQRLVVQEGRLELEKHLAPALMNRGSALLGKNQLSDALESFDQSIIIYRRLVKQEGHSELVAELAKALMNQGIAFKGLNKLPQALDSHEQAIIIYKRLVEQEGRREFEPELAKALMNRGIAFDKDKKLPQALDSYKQAIIIYERLVKQEGRRELEPDLAKVLINKGHAFVNQGRLPQALDSLGQSVDIYRRLVEQEGHRELEAELATGLGSQGMAYAVMGALPFAFVSYEQSIAIYRRLVEQEGRHELEPELAIVLTNQVTTFADLKQEIARTGRADLQEILNWANQNCPQ